MVEAFLRALLMLFWLDTALGVKESNENVQMLCTFKSQARIRASDYACFPLQIHVRDVCFPKGLAAQHFGDFGEGRHRVVRLFSKDYEIFLLVKCLTRWLNCG
jgi:hypothetical protein